jgi:queuine tRNA-ribosyltransferase
VEYANLDQWLPVRKRNFYHTRVSPLRGPLESEKITFASSSKNSTRKADVRGEEEPMLVKISDDGVKFRSTFDGQLIEFTPEKSMKYQKQIGADINMAFDECTYYPAMHEYAQKAMERTHDWLKRCIEYKDSGSKFLSQNKQKRKNFSLSSFKKQFLYGVIQGGTFEDLRKKSAEFVVSQNTEGVAIGGVSVGESKSEMRNQVRWVSDYLPKDRPVHLLGVGQIDDIIDLVKYGVDTFDCVEPTRLARMGTIYQMGNARHRKFFDGKQKTAKNLVSSLSRQIDITKNIYKADLSPVDEDCNCYVCKNFTKSYLHHLFKQREILGYTLMTYHNLWVMERLFDKIRELILEDKI